MLMTIGSTPQNKDVCLAMIGSRQGERGFFRLSKPGGITTPFPLPWACAVAAMPITRVAQIASVTHRLKIIITPPLYSLRETNASVSLAAKLWRTKAALCAAVKLRFVM